MDLAQYKMDSLIGPLYLIASDTALYGLHFRQVKGTPLVEKKNAILRETIKQLEEYFRGERQSFDVPLSTDGTTFQMQVWKELTRIPYGETRSYRDVAARIKNPKAVRAVGSANGRNPVSIIVPCHRSLPPTAPWEATAAGCPSKQNCCN